jgi:hypothetical protein
VQHCLVGSEMCIRDRPITLSYYPDQKPHWLYVLVG